MNVVAHIPPLKRIEIGRKPVAAPSQPSESIASQAIAAAKQELENERAQRIWRTIVQASQGQGSIEE